MKHPSFILLSFLLAMSSPGQNPKGSSPKAWIGISFLDVSSSKIPPQYKHRTKNGAVRIQQVFKDASGDQAGLQPGDFILAIDRVPLDGRKTLIESVSSKSVGQVVELKIGRGEKIFHQKMALSPRPEDMKAITRLLIGSKAPPLDGSYYSKHGGSLEENRGKIIILDFWATWCSPCLMTLPILEELNRDYYSRGVRIIGISSEPLETLKSFQQKHPHNYALFHDDSQQTQKKYMAWSYPTLVYIDRYGIIQRIEAGARSKEHIESRIRELLGL
ncbi:redoxin domain-containing protein [Fibrobacterota bacterium]